MRSKKSFIHIVAVAFMMLSAQAFASGRVTEIRYVNGWAELTVQTTPDKRYRIECCTDLAAGEWIGVAGFTATASVTVQEIASAAPSCFFRVVEIKDAPILPPPPPPPTGPPGPPPPAPR